MKTSGLRKKEKKRLSKKRYKKNKTSTDYTYIGRNNPISRTVTKSTDGTKRVVWKDKDGNIIKTKGPEGTNKIRKEQRKRDRKKQRELSNPFKKKKNVGKETDRGKGKSGFGQ